MDIAYIDNLSYNGDSILHRASAPAKMAFVVLVLTGVVVASLPLGLALGLALVLATAAVARLPLGRVLGAAGYALIFSSIFAISALRGDASFALSLLLKGSLAAVSLVLLVFTTPYVEIFSVLRRFMPVLLVDILFLTYRSFFIIVAETDRFFTALRLRGEYTPRNALRHLGPIGRMMGHNIIHAWEMGERMERVMAVRGYEGGIVGRRPWPALTAYDALPVALGVMVLFCALVGGRP